MVAPCSTRSTWRTSSIGRVAARSAGILLYRISGRELQVLLVHPGGPFWVNRDAGAWSIPKGEIEAGEEPLAAARREYAEELGLAVPVGEPVSLGEVRLRSGKRVFAWSLAGDADVAAVVSNTVTIRLRGREIEVPEVDRAGWFSLEQAREKLNPGQVPLIDRLETQLAA
jgi:predicted NUDIX family NTP pyrophosphohydrolase